jgi:hypothetical protein
VTTTDWIAAVQALFLAIGGLFAYRTFRLAATEHREARDEARRQPRRELTMDVVRELKYLSGAVETVSPGTGYYDANKVQAHLRRLQITLAVFQPDELPETRKLAGTQATLSQAAMRPPIDAATTELAREVVALEQPPSA